MKRFLTLRKNKKGFTLVELLVVLVILAILAAAIIPSMLGFIDKARDDAELAECRSISLAATAHVNEQYGRGTDAYTSDGGGRDILTADAGAEAAILTLADTNNGTADITGLTINVVNNHPAIATIAYTTTQGNAYTFAPDTGWTPVP